MIPKHRIPSHPGEILLEEFLEPLHVSQAALSRHLGISTQRVNELIKGKRGITPNTAWLLSLAFGTSPEFWMNLQNNHDLAQSKPKEKISKIAA
jgi:addiction module HigA family antidote